VISAGVESISMSTGKLMEEDARDPRFRTAWERTEKRASREIPAPWTDPREDGELPDAYIQMGQTAENVAELRGVERQAQDEFAVRSQNRAEAARESGFFAREITPITLPDGTVVDTDDSPRAGVTYEAVTGLDPVFRPDGTVTAGNCCPLNDGAAALVLMERGYAKELGITPLARVVATGVSGLSPEIMGLGPVEATRRALDLAGLTIEDIDLVELNEAFAAQVLPSAEDLGIDHEKLNVHGGAIALGHPWGSTGARLTTTLLSGLAEREGRYGLATLCVGGGQGMALIIERIK
jgi:acetyl-CoA C-acetyltransferase